MRDKLGARYNNFGIVDFNEVRKTYNTKTFKEGIDTKK